MERLEGIALILRAIELTIVEVERREDDDRDGQLETLRRVLDLWRTKAAEEGED